ncbi:MAG: cyanophycinase [Victivallales bacterium]|nr:cyanophycinase [Victivallales bacterium]
MTAKKLGNGTIIAIGGNEDKRNSLDVLRRTVEESKGRDTYVELVTTASRVPRELERTYENVFKRIGVYRFDAFNINSGYDADDKCYSDRLKEADLVFFTGGDQWRLTSILKNSLFMDTLKDCYYDGSITVAGTSAGAAAMSDTMIYGGKSKYGLIKDNISIGTGFNLVHNIAFDTHFVGRGRMLRLFQVVATNPDNLGIGLSEDTAIVMHDEYLFEVIGNGSVIIVDGSFLKDTNISKVNKGEIFYVENFHVHSLTAGFKYDLKERKVIYP